jgi:hypothetical protein
VSSEELAVPEFLPDLLTGEALEPTVANAAVALAAAREVKRRADEAIRFLTGFVVEESRRQGTKTLRTDAGKLEVSGGPKTVYDPADLAQALRDAGVPEERVDAAVRQEFTYKVDHAVLRQLVAANPAYAAAIKSVARTEEKPFQVKTS